MGGIRTPRSAKGAQALCERFATIEGEVEDIENTRNAAIAAANALADAQLEPLIAEREQITEKLEPWWTKEGPAMTAGKRKSIEHGGCLIGTRTGKEKLGYAGKPAELVALMKDKRWARELLRVSTSLDAKAITAALDGRHGTKLKELGFVIVPGEETFFVQRAEQQGTRR